jgi:hypothetical protein
LSKDVVDIPALIKTICRLNPLPLYPSNHKPQAIKLSGPKGQEHGPVGGQGRGYQIQGLGGGQYRGEIRDLPGLDQVTPYSRSAIYHCIFLHLCLHCLYRYTTVLKAPCRELSYRLISSHSITILSLLYLYLYPTALLLRSALPQALRSR